MNNNSGKMLQTIATRTSRDKLTLRDPAQEYQEKQIKKKKKQRSKRDHVLKSTHTAKSVYEDETWTQRTHKCP